MKTMFLMAAALIAAPALGQMTPTDTGAATPPPSSPVGTPPTDSSAMQQTMPAPAQGAMGTMTPGGYQPSAPAMSGTMTPGVTPVFQAAPTPAQAFPPPAPMDSYPMCKPGQFDHCKQGPGSTHAHSMRKHKM